MGRNSMRILGSEAFPGELNFLALAVGCFLALEFEALMSISQTGRAPLCHGAVSDRGANTGNLGPPLAEQVCICKWTDCSASICLLVELCWRWVLWAGAVIATGVTEIFKSHRGLALKQDGRRRGCRASAAHRSKFCFILSLTSRGAFYISTGTSFAKLNNEACLWHKHED